MLSRRAAIVGRGRARGRHAGGDAGPQVLTAADVHVAGYPTVEAVRWIGEDRGRDRRPARHPGLPRRPARPRADTVEMARFGAIDLTRVNLAALNNAFPLTQVPALPYVFDSVAHMRRAMDGAPGRRILEGFASRGLVGLCIYDSGVRCVYNVRRPIHTPADLAGLKIRVPPSDIFIEIGRALGANPTPLSFGEVYSSLQTHLIDGAENNIHSFRSSRQFEVAKHWSETRHSYSPEALLMSRRGFERLGRPEQELLLRLASESVPYMRDLWDVAEAESRASVLAAGVQINETDLAAFEAATAPLVERRLGNPDLRRLYDDIRGLA